MTGHAHRMMGGMHTVEAIAHVQSPRTAIADDDWGGVVSHIVVEPRFGPEALAGLADFSHLEVLYHFDRVAEERIETGARRPRNREDWPLVGIFAQRGKNRPNRLGLCTCEILAVEDRIVTVRGLDALDGTPVLDMKPVMREFLPRGPVRQPAWADAIMAAYFAGAPAPAAPGPVPELLPATRERLVAWQADPAVLGVIWVGSRVRGYGDAGSDDDLEVVLETAAHAALAPADTYEVLVAPDLPRRALYDAHMTTLADLVAKAASARDLDHWPFAAARVLHDRDGRAAAAVAACAAMAPAFRRARLQHGALDAVAAVTRARKTEARGHMAAAALLTARTAKALTRVLFALEHRWAPLEHWLEPELATLADPTGAGALLRQALQTHTWQPLATALVRLEDRLAAEGFPRPAGHADFFSLLMHPSRAAERALHGLD